LVDEWRLIDQSNTNASDALTDKDILLLILSHIISFH
jgi:hypothetical protein